MNTLEKTVHGQCRYVICIIFCVLLIAASAGQAANLDFLGPANPRVEDGSDHWYFRTNGSAVAFVGHDPSGSNTFILGNTAAGQSTADLRSETFLVPAAIDHPLTFSFAYKLPDRVHAGDNVHVNLRFFGTNLDDYLDQKTVLVGSSSGDSNMIDYGRIIWRGITGPKGARMADVWITANINHPWTSGLAMFNDFSVRSEPVQTAEPGFLGPANPRAESVSDHWNCRTSGSAVAFVGHDPMSGSNTFILGNTAAGQSTADLRSETFLLPAAIDYPLTFSFAYKLPELVKAGDNVHVNLRFFGTNLDDYLEQVTVLVGSSSKDSSMTHYKRITQRGITVPEGARMADVWITANINYSWTSGLAMFNDFSVVWKPLWLSRSTIRHIITSFMVLFWVVPPLIVLLARRVSHNKKISRIPSSVPQGGRDMD
jgi:hypothetical protein